MTDAVSEVPAATRRPRSGRWGAEVAAVLRLGVPMVALNLGQSAIQTTDTVMVGRLGTAPLAAIMLGANLYYLVMMFAVGVLMAVAALTAQAHGARDARGVRRTVGQGLWLAAALALPTLATLAAAEPLYRLTGQEPALSAAAAGYIQARMGGFPLMLVANVLACFLAALNRPQVATAFTALAVVANFGFNWVLIYGAFGVPGLGVVGAGYSSALVDLLQAGGLALFCGIDPRLRRYRLFVGLARPDWPRFARLWRVGYPIGMARLGEVGMIMVATLMIGRFGAAPLAAHAVAMQYAAISFMVPFGLGLAGTVRVGQAVGRADPAGVGRAGWTTLAISTAVTAVAAAVFLTVPETLVGLFLSSDHADDRVAAALAVRLLAVAAVFQVGDSSQGVTTQLLRGLSDTRIPMLIALGCFWGIAIPCSWAFGFQLGLGSFGVWLGLAVGLTAAAVLLVLRFADRDRLDLLDRARAQVTAAG